MGYGVSEETEITEVVRGLQGSKAKVPSKMRAEYLKGWLQEATQKKRTEMYWWTNVVRLIQLEFLKGELIE